MKKYNDNLEQAINLLLDKSERIKPVKQLPTPTTNIVIKVVIPVIIIGTILFTVWYMAMHPNL